jgi:phage FluMu gp28-like protein
LIPTRYVGLYAGWDIARHRHLSVIWLNELLGDVALCRGIIELSNIPTPDQVNEARRLLSGRNPIVNRICIDVGSMGLAMFETLEKEFGSNAVEGVTFSLPTKEALAVHAKTRMEKRLTRVPDLDIVRSSFRMVKKSVTTTGAARFDADEEKRYGHADHWWAFCLALSAESHASYGLLSYFQKQAAEGKQIANQGDEHALPASANSQKRESPGCPECGWPHLSQIPGGHRCQQCGAQILKANVTVIPPQNRYAHLNHRARWNGR